MIRQAYEMFAQEPWSYKPWEMERLTDWQIEYLYAKPAALRSEEMRKEGSTTARPAPANREPMPEPGTDAHRALIVTGMMAGPFAYSREKAESAYDKQLAAYRAGGT